MIPPFRSDASRLHAIGAARLPIQNDTDWNLSPVHHDSIGSIESALDGTSTARTRGHHLGSMAPTKVPPTRR